MDGKDVGKIKALQGPDRVLTGPIQGVNRATTLETPYVGLVGRLPSLVLIIYNWRFKYDLKVGRFTKNISILMELFSYFCGFN